MRILYAVHAYKPAYRIGGPVLSVSAAAEMLVRKGHEVIVFTTNSNLDEELDVPLDRPVKVNGVEVRYFRRAEPLQKWLPFVPYLSRSMGFMYCPAMKESLERVVPTVDLVDTHMPFVYPTYAAAHAAFRLSKPVFYHSRGNFAPERLRFRGGKKWVYINLVERPIMRRATTLIALTEGERDWFRGLGVKTHCEVVPNGIDLPPPRPWAAEKVLERFGVPRDAVLVLFLGRLHPTKGADKLLAAFREVGKDLPDTFLLMAGPDEWKLQSQWSEQLGSSELSARVLFPGMVTGDEKADILARADLFCLPSVGEGFSMAVLEALASRTAVMISPACNFPEVAEFDAGVLVEPEVVSLGEAMRRLTVDRRRLGLMGEAGRKLVAERYSWNAITDRLIRVYESGIERVAA